MCSLVLPGVSPGGSAPRWAEVGCIIWICHGSYDEVCVGSDVATKALLIQSLLPGLLQLRNEMRLEIPQIAEPPEIDSADRASEKPPQGS